MCIIRGLNFCTMKFKKQVFVLFCLLPFNFASAAPFSCDGSFFQVARFSGMGGGQQVLATLDVGEKGYTDIGTLTSQLNGTGYRNQDNFIYGITSGAPRVARLHSDATLEVLGSPVEGSILQTTSGDVSPDGFLYTYIGSRALFQVIDVSVDPVVIVEEVPFDLSTISSGRFLVDFAFAPNGDIHMLHQQNYFIGKFTGINDPSTVSSVSFTPISTNGTVPVIAGAQFVDGNGAFYASINDSGEVVRFNPSNSTFETVVTPINLPSNPNDGASCRQHTPLGVKKSSAPKAVPALPATGSIFLAFLMLSSALCFRKRLINLG